MSEFTQEEKIKIQEEAWAMMALLYPDADVHVYTPGDVPVYDLEARIHNRIIVEWYRSDPLRRYAFKILARREEPMDIFALRRAIAYMVSRMQYYIDQVRCTNYFWVNEESTVSLEAFKR